MITLRGQGVTASEIPEGAIRQSHLRMLDECSLGFHFDTLTPPHNTHPQAGGILFHAVMAEILLTLKAEGEEEMPTQEAIEILYEVARQRDVPPDRRIRCSMRDLALVRMGVLMTVESQKFSIDRLEQVEERLTVPITYVDDNGEVITRLITGQPDALLSGANDIAEVLDWKLTWALPPERKDPTDHDRQFGHHVSYEGYFQQRFYAFLVMTTYPTIMAVRLREYYPLRRKVRAATVERDALEHIERELSLLVYEHDKLLASDGPYLPSPGKHCGYCSRPHRCPLQNSERGIGAIQSAAMAERYAAEREVADVVRKDRTEALKVWVAQHGPVRIKASKERREIGWRIGKDKTKNFGPYIPDAGDMKLVRDETLEAQMRASVREAREARRRAATG